MFQVANLACSMSNNEDGVKMVRMAAAQIESLCPQVINAARVLTARPKSKVWCVGGVWLGGCVCVLGSGIECSDRKSFGC